MAQDRPVTGTGARQPSVNICITASGTTDDVVDYVKFVAEQIAEGYTSGIVDAQRNWDLE